MPSGLGLIDANFSRQGPDLLVTDGDGTTVLVVGYFSVADTPALITEGGTMLAGHVITALAGPLAPEQYAQLGGAGTATPIGKVATMEGAVTATRAGGATVNLAIDDPVFQGDVLVTEAAASVGLVFNDKTTFALGEQGRMVLDELIYDPDTGDGSSAFSVVKGVFVFVSGVNRL